MPVEHQIALPVTGLPGQVVGFTVCRSSGRDFTAADLEILILLGPHLARLHRQQQQAARHQSGAAGSACATPTPIAVPEPRAAATAAACVALPLQRREAPPCDASAATKASCVPAARPASRLTSRERQVLDLAGGGRTSASIGRELHCSTRTIDKHLENAYRKLGVSNRLAALSNVDSGVTTSAAPGSCHEGCRSDATG